MYIYTYISYVYLNSSNDISPWYNHGYPIGNPHGNLQPQRIQRITDPAPSLPAAARHSRTRCLGWSVTVAAARPPGKPKTMESRKKMGLKDFSKSLWKFDFGMGFNEKWWNPGTEATQRVRQPRILYWVNREFAREERCCLASEQPNDSNFKKTSAFYQGLAIAQIH